MVAVVLAVLAVVVAGWSPPVGAQNQPSAHIEPGGGPVDTRVTITGEGWPGQSLVLVELCGNRAARGSVDCAREGARTGVVDISGHFEAVMALPEPPVPCPCVMRLTSTSGSAMVLVDIALDTSAVASLSTPADPAGPSTPADPADPAAPADPADPADPGSTPSTRRSARAGSGDVPQRALQIVAVEMTGGSSWKTLLGLRAERTLAVTIANTGTAPIQEPNWTVAVGRGDHPTGAVDVPDLGLLPPGEQRTYLVPFSLDPLSWGTYTVRGEVFGLDEPTTFSTTTSTWPYLLPVVGLAVLQALLLVVRNRMRRRVARAVARQAQHDGPTGAAAFGPTGPGEARSGEGAADLGPGAPGPVAPGPVDAGSGERPVDPGSVDPGLGDAGLVDAGSGGPFGGAWDGDPAGRLPTTGGVDPADPVASWGPADRPAPIGPLLAPLEADGHHGDPVGAEPAAGASAVESAAGPSGGSALDEPPSFRPIGTYAGAVVAADLGVPSELPPGFVAAPRPGSPDPQTAEPSAVEPPVPGAPASEPAASESLVNESPAFEPPASEPRATPDSAPEPAWPTALPVEEPAGEPATELAPEPVGEETPVARPETGDDGDRPSWAWRSERRGEARGATDEVEAPRPAGPRGSAAEDPAPSWAWRRRRPPADDDAAW